MFCYSVEKVEAQTEQEKAACSIIAAAPVIISPALLMVVFVHSVKDFYLYVYLLTDLPNPGCVILLR